MDTNRGSEPRRANALTLAALVGPTVVTGIAFAVLRSFGVLGNLPRFVLLPVLAAAGVVSELFGRRLTRDSSRLVLHTAVAAQVLAVATVTYAIGWGAALSIGYVFVLSRLLDDADSRVWRVALAWTVVGVTLGECAIAVGIVPTYIPEPDVHVLAVLGVLGTAFVMYLLGVKTSQSEESLRRRDDAERELRNTLSLLTATLDATADGIVVAGTDGVLGQYNAQFASMWHLPDNAAAVRDLDAIGAILDQLLRPELFLARFEEIKGDPEADSADVLEFKDGRVYERRSRPQRIDGNVVGRVWSFRDVTDKNRLVNELAHQAFHDSLTGLANRALLRDRLEHALARARRSGATVSVLFCDLDGFKMVNDTMGHDAGDMLLVEVAHRFLHSIREGDTVARLGGDEFAIVVDETTANGATVLARRLLDVLSDPFVINGREVFVRASVGIADNHAEVLDADELLCRADIAMYAAKSNGRDRFEIFESTMQVDLTHRHELYGDLRHALAVGQFTLYYQPLVDLASNKVESIEALLRWRHPTRGIVGPDEIIPICEETGLIIDVGRWVLREACRQLAEWSTTIDAQTRISVNISAQQMYHESFVADVSAALSDAGLEGQRLVLELTESTLLSNTALVHERLEALKAIGVHVAIDDFGTGYSSLSYLHLFPVDVLKIDRSFVQRLNSGSDDQSDKLVRSIVGMAENLGLGVVAEGIEQEDQLAAVRDAGCATGQDFLFARPLPADQVTLVVARLSRAPTSNRRTAAARSTENPQ